ncbi:MAG: phage baseplate protein [Gammaproteobacteria bacterium]|nr:phage baseplate protein [Gammaproteobacteria bacterium]
MNALGAAEMLGVWERGLGLPMLERTLMLVAIARPDLESAEAARLSIGQRDASLLRLRERLFGTRLVNSAVCPACAERIEWENSTRELRVESDSTGAPDEEFEVSEDAFRVRFHLPNSLDLADVTVEDTPEEAVRKMLESCISSASREGSPCDVQALPETVIEALGKRIEALDPQAEIEIRLTCPNCEHGWAVLFDIASFLWTELSDWAERLLLAVHDLASTFHWTEQDILRLSPVRRQLYLGMVR